MINLICTILGLFLIYQEPSAKLLVGTLHHTDSSCNPSYHSNIKPNIITTDPQRVKGVSVKFHIHYLPKCTENHINTPVLKKKFFFTENIICIKNVKQYVFTHTLLNLSQENVIILPISPQGCLPFTLSRQPPAVQPVELLISNFLMYGI
jgi:hypothetical protein